jgi:hypothetical protein
VQDAADPAQALGVETQGQPLHLQGGAGGTCAAGALDDDDKPERSADLASALRGIGRVETEVEALLRTAESLAEQAVTQGAQAVPGAGAVPALDLIDSLNRTIRRLQSVSTAVALVCDGSQCAERWWHALQFWMQPCSLYRWSAMHPW